MTLLGETPEQSSDFKWEHMSPAGHEFPLGPAIGVIP